MIEPLVTICIPNYNKAQFIKETILSVYTQTYRNIEIIVIDDCSTDNSMAIIEAMKEISPFPFFIFKNICNKGVSFSANKGAKLAKGIYFQILSSDDILLMDKIQTQVDILEGDKEIAGVYGNVSLIDENSRPVIKNYFRDIGWDKDLPSGNIFSELLFLNFVPAPTTLFKTNRILEAGNYDVCLRMEDWDMLLSISEKYKITYCNKTFALYRVVQNSLQHSPANKHNVFTAMCETLLKKRGRSAKLDDIIYKNINRYSAIIYACGSPTAKYWLRKGLNNKWNSKNFLFYAASILGIPYSFYNKFKS